MTTRERIVEAALALFNEKGTGAVSTNHIAAACGISPGNLYYHFRNKEEIIRAIFEQMTRVGIEEYEAIARSRPPETGAAVTAILDTFVMVQRFNWRFRFFKRELTILLRNDPILAETFAGVHRAHRELVRESIERFIADGIIVPLGETERELFVEELWLLLLFWLNYLEVGGETIDEATLARGNAVLFNAIHPRLTKEALKALEERKLHPQLSSPT